jgi:hypothetical protein
VKPTKLKWRALVLVCGKCDKRGGGRSLDVSSAQARRQLKRGLRDLKPPVGVVKCGCLGVCPKNALLIACALPGDNRPTAAAVKSSADLKAFRRHLREKFSKE